MAVQRYQAREKHLTSGIHSTRRSAIASHNGSSDSAQWNPPLAAAEPVNGTDPGEFSLFDRKPAAVDAAREILAGLTAEPKYVSAKFFYDHSGSELFEAITQLPEYYLTRTEMALFDAYQQELAAAIGSNVCLVEYGSGSSVKVRKLLESVRPQAYVPVDISHEHLEAMALDLHQDFPWLNIYPTCADFTQPFTLPEPVQRMRKVGFFPGSSIGNFEPSAATQFLRNAASTLGPGSRFVVGVDRKKDQATLEAAYNDANGVTAAFNLNLLNHLSELLDAEFFPDRFRHRATYNEALGCIQMFLEPQIEHQVTVGREKLRFQPGEAVHTENSFKYHPHEFLAVAAAGGYRDVAMWTDARDWFAVFLLETQSD